MLAILAFIEILAFTPRTEEAIKNQPRPVTTFHGGSGGWDNEGTSMDAMFFSLILWNHFL